MRSIRLAGLGLALACLWAGSAGPLLAADSGTVDAQVTVATPCLITTPSTIDFGTMPFSSSNNAWATSTVWTNYENCSAADEQIYARGTNATTAAGGDPATWTLDNVVPLQICGGGIVNTYALALGIAVGTPPVWLATSDSFLQQVATGYNAASPATLVMPCVGSDGGGAVMSFQITFTATF